MDTFALPTTKKRRNAHGLQLSSRSLAPPPANHGASSTSALHPGMIQDALSEFINMNQATPTVSSARVVDDERAQTPTQASHQGVETTGGKSKISRKKPVDLNISKSIAPEGIRKAPLLPGSSAQELESTLASMEITPNGTKLSSSTKPRSSSTLDAPRKPSTKTKSRKPGSSAGREKEALDSGPFGELKNDEFKVMQDLGAGAGGTVDKVIHVPTGTIMAKKVSPCLPLRTSCFALETHSPDCSSYSSMQNQRSANKSSGNSKSCMAVRRPTSLAFTERSCGNRISVSVWSTWTERESHPRLSSIGKFP